MEKYVSYAQSGVDIDANEQMIQKIWSSVAGTYGPRVIESKGGFAGMFRLDYDEKLFKKNYRNPVLVAGTDGVGSKVQLAALMKKYDTVGIDLVAMSIHDMLVVGAEPLFFLDYIGIHKLEPQCDRGRRGARLRGRARGLAGSPRSSGRARRVLDPG
ncbi:MAG: AIR synthase related protein, partial [Sedimentisphaerales bacterium]